MKVPGKGKVLIPWEHCKHTSLLGLIYTLERIISFETYKKRSEVNRISPKKLIQVLNPYISELCLSLEKISSEDKNLIMGWVYKGAPLKRGTGSYPLARRLIIEKLLPSFKEKLVYEDDPIFPQMKCIFLSRFEHILDTESPQKITGEYEIQFSKPT